MVLLPPGCTLFPYTTLFRSGRCAPTRNSSKESERREGVFLLNRSATLVRLIIPLGGIAGSNPAPATILDRKSTPPNSNHCPIPYDVHCCIYKSLTDRALFRLKH